MRSKEDHKKDAEGGTNAGAYEGGAAAERDTGGTVDEERVAARAQRHADRRAVVESRENTGHGGLELAAAEDVNIDREDSS